ncbi:MAG: nitroreductase family protein [Thermoguttaceae bacterium]|nr:nitroreductase family protein [Thermoguttaceae bacterium]MBQ1864011.1 nitroreductase family protein [Thermoguttaceae bacterium]MBQ2039762.1 nitroreductase family protein [Thermoguttaceae bacterium]MBQ4202611.1 nitroreductase family protein [Thermoguttaceae bacterium]
MNEQDVYDAIVTRRSTRNYKPTPVEPEKLARIIDAGRYAPSGGNSQTNRFFVVQKQEIIADLIKLVEEAFSKMDVYDGMYRSLRNSILRSKEGGYLFCYNAPVLVVVANKKDYGNNMADCAVAIENMMVEANALDLGSCWINQLRWLNEEPTLLEYMRKLGLPEDERVYGAAIFGYPATEDGKPNRVPLPRTGVDVVYL